MEPAKPNPIVVVSFNRPHYLTPVLDSLAAQTALNGRPIYMFQDNGVSPYTGHRFGTDESIQECMELFRAKFPDGTVFLAPHNLGVCRNFKRAEEFVFRDLGSEAAYFFEDDMVLSPHYLAMMDYIHANIAADDKVGYFAAYGKHRFSMRKQIAHKNKMGRLGFHWAFGITRKCWLDLREWLEPYYQMCEGTDYRRRPSPQIAEYYRSRGFPVDCTTQDHTKKVGTYCVGRISINTYACYARYIGEKGLHTTPEIFTTKKYSRTELFPEPVELNFPTPEDIARYTNEEINRRWRSVRAKTTRAEEEARTKAEEKAAAKAERRAERARLKAEAKRAAADAGKGGPVSADA